MTKTVGTLREIGARVGDVVEYVADGGKYKVKKIGILKSMQSGLDIEYMGFWDSTGTKFRIITRASRPFNTLTAEEKGELLLANHEGKIIEMSIDGGETWERSYTPQWIGSACYRVKEDEVKEVVIYSMSDLTTWLDKEYGLDTHRITFNLVNGKPDCASVKMEEIK